jgi:tRNA (Thr-GGU) A37 N-methylase
VKVFATRMPVRPNPIGLSVVELLEFSPATGELVVRGLDAVDGTPVLDIKPYIANFDSLPDATVPEWVAEHLNSHFHAGHVHEQHRQGAMNGEEANRTGHRTGEPEETTQRQRVH